MRLGAGLGQLRLEEYFSLDGWELVCLVVLGIGNDGIIDFWGSEEYMRMDIFIHLYDWKPHYESMGFWAYIGRIHLIGLGGSGGGGLYDNVCSIKS